VEGTLKRDVSDPASVDDVGAAYDARSREYVELFGDLEAFSSADRALVSRWRDTTSGRLLDAGCGPGQWTTLLRDGGRDVLGVDLSKEFLHVARTSNPAVPFLAGSLTALPLQSETVGGLLAWYSIIHTRPAALPSLLAECRRVLRPDGTMLVGFCDGDPGQSFDHAVVTAYWWSVDALRSLLNEAGFVVVEHHRRQDAGRRPHAALIARPRSVEAR
jgi:SAM-dependent methyltransferase